MHRECGLAHYDLKLENIVVDKHKHVKLIDFDLADDLNIELSTPRGTLGYIAPELTSRTNPSLVQKLRSTPPLAGPYEGDKADVFSLGVLLFLMFFGQFPFKQTSLKDPLFESLSSGSY